MNAPIDAAATAAGPSRSAFQRRIALVFAAEFLSLGIFMPFFPVWLADEGLTPDQIGLVLALQTGLRILTVPAVLRFADRAGERADVLVAMAFGSAAIVNLFFVLSGFPALLVGTILVCAVWAPLVPLADAIALSGVRRVGIDYGRARLWGSIAFIVVNLAAGLVIAEAGTQAFLPLLSASFALGALATLASPRVGRPRFASPLPAGAAGEPVAAPRSLLVRLRPEADVARLLPLMLALGLVQSSHAMYNGFSSILWTDLGYSGFAIGLFWSVGVVAEVVVFRYAGRFVPRLGARALVLVSGSAAILRWLAMGYDLGLAGFLLLAVLHGLTFGCAWIALQMTIAGSVRESRIGAAQGLGFALQIGLTALATAAGGPLYEAWGGKAFAAMAVLAATGLLIAFSYPQRAASGGETSEP